MAAIDRIGRAIDAIELRRKDLEMQAEIRRRVWDARHALLQKLRHPWAERRQKGGPR